MNYRIDKYLSMALPLTRQEAKAAIRTKEVVLNGETVTRPEQKLDPETDELSYKGNPVTYEAYVYYMLHKPQGVVSATKDNLYPTVIDLINDPVHTDLFPVGRLDVDTEGLLLITNDGKLGHDLTAPGKHVDKVYEVKVDGILTPEHIRVLQQGIDIGEEKLCLPAKLEILSSSPQESHARITIQEGRFHQVKRMFQSLGLKVTYLKRLQMGTLVLDEKLALGEYRKLTKDEVESLCIRNIRQ